ncbi:preprotein translocase subunit SecA [Candidatus Peregrinibacteria bacterium CG_4_10_14_0_2_um_filter_38_24]|nr:MAG: preprotein translocase subunit SecA [Candidatus Peregrinibacteria bacterium CG_4_10_14_0_2_um_filter_38_24]PJC39031.1 MAG: preprotein translocase subunit SecA [Candidatus Peregrinibacteria bacterium CG_4_9_14_0_2_um_filter_38_9]
MQKILNKLLGDPNEKALKKIRPLVQEILAIEEKYQKEITTQEQVKAKTEEFKERLKNGETLDQILPEAFALVKTACRHLMGKSWTAKGREVTWDMIPYDVQLIGGIVLHQGNIAEMKTGEGKTLVCTMPIYLNALLGRGAYLVTVNDYLAHRDAEWMGGLYNYLGLSVGVTVHGMSHAQKKEAYACDITYGTNNEFGFDYLRDNMVTDKEEITQRDLYYAIVDEVDSILIDEARTPLIISTQAEESTSKYQKHSKLIQNLEENTDYVIDEKLKTATLTEAGIVKMEGLLGVENIYTESGFEEVHHLEQALRAKACYKNDIDYIIKDGEILIIDEFTGRLMPGRRYSHGLHQAIEAKENVEIKRESKTLATVSFQNYFRLFERLGGMTGTALTEAEEFYQIYGLDTIVIPSNRKIQRLDKTDAIYKTFKGKMLAATKLVKELNKKGQPVLVGTVSVEKSEILSKLFTLEGIPHTVLNAKNHEKEAEIVSNAGQKGAVTIATNMAGRGTDIKLEKGVQDLGGLFVLGTERHEARRIDNQLRGRSGRQGDPGASQFLTSMDDDLMRLFGGDKIKGMMELLKVPEDMPIENSIISRSIEGAQKKVEGHNFDIRKHLVEYDDIMNIHRNIIYKQRKNYLFKDEIKEDIIQMITESAENIVINNIAHRDAKDWNKKEIFEALTAIHKDDNALTQEQINTIIYEDELIEKAKSYLLEAYKKREKSLPDPKILRGIEKAVILRSTDTLWMDHIDTMQNLRESVAFSGYAQKDPLTEYKALSFELFNELMAMINSNTLNTLFKIDLEKVVPQEMLKRAEIKQIQTNDAEIEKPLSSKNPVIVKTSGATGSQLTERASTGGTVIHMSDKDSGPVVGRNDPCPCGSGKKHKKCCG